LTKPIYILGAGGHALSTQAVLEDTKIDIMGFIDYKKINDDNEKKNKFYIYSKNKISENIKLVLGIGSIIERKNLIIKFKNKFIENKIIHFSAYSHKSVKIKNGTILHHNAFVGPEALINEFCVINTGAIIEHNSHLGQNCFIGPSAVVCGNCKIGPNCFIGAGATIVENVMLCEGVTVGSGSTVLNSIDIPGIYVGSPARLIKK